MDYHDAIAKASKLLRLAKSNNPNEAAVAAAKAQELIDRYQLNMLALSDGAVNDERISHFDDDPLDRVASTWRGRLAVAIAKVNACRVVHANVGLTIVGRPSDAATVRMLYAWLVEETDRFTRRECRGKGRIYGNNFRLGMIETIRDRLKEQQQATQQEVRAEATNEFALVRIETAIAKREAQGHEVVRWMRQNVPTHRSSRSFIRDDGARAHGRVVGHQVSLSAHAKLSH